MIRLTPNKTEALCTAWSSDANTYQAYGARRLSDSGVFVSTDAGSVISPSGFIGSKVRMAGS